MHKEETYDPTVTPQSEIVSEYEELRGRLSKAIRSKHTMELEALVVEATERYPMELESQICHAEFIIKQYYERLADSNIDLNDYDSELDIEDLKDD